MCGAQCEPCKSLVLSFSQNLLNFSLSKSLGEVPQSKLIKPSLYDTFVPDI